MPGQDVSRVLLLPKLSERGKVARKKGFLRLAQFSHWQEMSPPWQLAAWLLAMSNPGGAHRWHLLLGRRGPVLPCSSMPTRMRSWLRRPKDANHHLCQREIRTLQPLDLCLSASRSIDYQPRGRGGNLLREMLNGRHNFSKLYR